MYQFSDSDSKDSDEGIRFKTDSTRNKRHKTRRDNDDRPSSRRRRSRSKSRDRSRRSTPKKSRSSRRTSSSSDRDRSKRKTTDSRTSRRKEDENSRKSESKRRKSPETSRNEDKPNSKPTPPPSPSSKEVDKTPSYVGPQLPPHLLLTKKEPSSSIGPVLPPNSVENIEQISDSEKAIPPAEDPRDLEQIRYIGPSMPPHLRHKSEDSHEEEVDGIGPKLPPHLRVKDEEEVVEEQEEEAPILSCIGPTLPPHLRGKLQQQLEEPHDDDDDVYGPLPVGHSNYSQSQIALEERALQLKIDQLQPNNDKGQIREEWMLELPEVNPSRLGLGPRQFRSKAGPDLSDRSSWTNTPKDKKAKKSDEGNKIDLKKEAAIMAVEKHDLEQEEINKKLKTKRKDSLLDIHQEKLKKKQKEDNSGPSERRPFSRDVDLQVNRFDEAQKKAILKKAQLLDDRFSRGQSKFL